MTTSDTYDKVLIALEQSAPSARDEFVEWARKQAIHEAIGRAEVEHLDEETNLAHSNKPLRFYAYAALWVPPEMAHDLVGALPSDTHWFRLRDRLAFDRSARPDEERVWAGVKKTTPWVPMEGVDTALWQGRYCNHGVIAKEYHATCVRYRQNLVLEGSIPKIGAVSELWWTNPEDLVDRFYLSAEAQQLLAFDTRGFIDVNRAYPTVTIQETLRIGPATIGTGGFV